MGFSTLTTVGESLQYNYPLVGGLHTLRVWDLIISQVCLSYQSCGSFFICLVVDDLFWQVLVFFNDCCSADCYFDVFIRGGKLRVLLCNLAISSAILAISNHAIFILYSHNVTCHLNQFSYFESSLQLRDKSHLVVA